MAREGNGCRVNVNLWIDKMSHWNWDLVRVRWKLLWVLRISLSIPLGFWRVVELSFSGEGRLDRLLRDLAQKGIGG